MAKIDVVNNSLNLTTLDNMLTSKVDIGELHKQGITSIQKNGYTLLKYNKTVLKMTPDNTLSLGRFRSVILRDNDIVSFAPIKSISKEQYKQLGPAHHVVEEFIDGTMISCFYDKHSRQWECATRSVIGAETRFFDENSNGRQMTFKEMFQEAFKCSDLRWDMFNREYVYSFVLQHPCNRIVVPIKRPTLWLIEVYEIENRHVRRVDTSAECFRDLLCHVSTPQIYMQFNTNNSQDYENIFNSFINDLENNVQDYRKMGFVVRSGLMRYKFRFPAYEHVKRLRGNNSKLQYQYYSLRKAGAVKEFLTYFPEYRLRFAEFRKILHEFTHQLWSNYLACFVHHKFPISQFENHFQRHMLALHMIYLNQLLPRESYVSKQVVIQYVNSRHPSDIIHSINYHS